MPRSTSKLIVSQEEIRLAFSGKWAEIYPPIILLKDVAALCGMSPKTISEWIAKGLLDRARRRRGKRNLFWRDRVIFELFNSPEWKQSRLRKAPDRHSGDAGESGNG